MCSTASDPLGALRDALRELAEADLAAVPGSQLGEQLVELGALSARLAFEQARRAAAFDASGAPHADGFATAASWIRANTTATPAEARDLVRVGRALRDRLPAAAAAARAGAIPFATAVAIERSLREVRDPQVLAEADRALAEHAPTLAPAQIPHAAQRLLEHLDPELAQRDAAQRWADRTLAFAPLLDGSVAVHGQMDGESAAVVLSALAPLMTPRGPQDTRSTGQRRLDALVELVAKAAETGAAGAATAAALPPTLLVKVDVQTLTALEPAALDPAALDTAALETAALDAPVDPQSDPAAARACTRGDALRRPPLAQLEWGGPILRAALERIGCSAQIVRLVTEGQSRVLDLGRARRLSSPAQRLALAARDNGCVFPGCDRPPGWTDAHHIQPWTEGGSTDLHDLVLLCRFHHRLHHEGGGGPCSEPTAASSSSTPTDKPTARTPRRRSADRATHRRRHRARRLDSAAGRREHRCTHAEEGPMRVTRIIADLPVADLDSAKQFYIGFLGLSEEEFNLGWVARFTDPTIGLNLQLVTRDATAAATPVLSVGTDDVDGAYAQAQALGYDIVHPLTTEAWGVRRFLVRDADGNILNIHRHLA